MTYKNLTDSGYVFYDEFWGSGYYKVFNDKTNYIDALDICSSYETSLIVPKSGISQNYIRAVLMLVKDVGEKCMLAKNLYIVRKRLTHFLKFLEILKI